MQMPKNRLYIWAAMLAILLMLSGGSVQAQSGNRGRSNFDWIAARRISITPLGLTVAGDSELADVTATGDATIEGDMALGGDLALTTQTAITMTNGATLTPTGAYQPIRSSGSIGFGAITAGASGQLLVLTNQTNTTITITDTGTLKLSGNAALGQYDSLELIFDGTNWIQLAKTDN